MLERSVCVTMRTFPNPLTFGPSTESLTINPCLRVIVACVAQQKPSHGTVANGYKLVFAAALWFSSKLRTMLGVHGILQAYHINLIPNQVQF